MAVFYTDLTSSIIYQCAHFYLTCHVQGCTAQLIRYKSDNQQVSRQNFHIFFRNLSLYYQWNYMMVLITSLSIHGTIPCVMFSSDVMLRWSIAWKWCDQASCGIKNRKLHVRLHWLWTHLILEPMEVLSICETYLTKNHIFFQKAPINWLHILCEKQLNSLGASAFARWLNGAAYTKHL